MPLNNGSNGSSTATPPLLKKSKHRDSCTSFWFHCLLQGQLSFVWKQCQTCRLYMWMRLSWDVLRLACFVMCLSPGFWRFAWYYFVTSNRVSVRYSSCTCRQTLDVYTPSTTTTTTTRTTATRTNQTQSLLRKRPVVVFYTGGAWCIGYKMWGALLARALTAAGMIVVIPDYRNYPSVCIPEMVDDVQASLAWTIEHVHKYGGDANKIVVVGQSAGGHLACTLILQQALQEQQQAMAEATAAATAAAYNNNSTNNDCIHRTIRGFVGLSVPYDLHAMQTTFWSHGIDHDIVDRVFGGKQADYTPLQLLQKSFQHKNNNNGQPPPQEDNKANQRRRGSSKRLHVPPMLILHGTHDKTVPHDASVQFCRKLTELVGSKTDNLDDDKPAAGGGVVTFRSYNGWSHTDGILEMPMNANHLFHKDVFDAVQQWTTTTTTTPNDGCNDEDDQVNDENDDRSNNVLLVWPEKDDVICKRLCPKLLIGFGQWCNPF